MESKVEKNILKGSSCMILAFFFVSLFGLFVKFSSTDSGPFWSCFLLYFFGLLIQGAIVLRKGVSFLKTKRPWGHFFRGFVGAFATVFYILAMKTIPLMNATLLFNLGRKKSRSFRAGMNCANVEEK